MRIMVQNRLLTIRIRSGMGHPDRRIFFPRFALAVAQHLRGPIWLARGLLPASVVPRCSRVGRSRCKPVLIGMLIVTVHAFVLIFPLACKLMIDPPRRWPRTTRPASTSASRGAV